MTGGNGSMTGGIWKDVYVCKCPSFFGLGGHKAGPYIYNNTQELYMVICHFLWFGA
jgi:hypothetical protein